jgi:SAM-dependent methyltransferase
MTEQADLAMTEPAELAMTEPAEPAITEPAEPAITEPADLAYLNGLYARDRDPWHLREGWYEHRKLQLLLACLPRERYTAAFEPGCSVGEVTAGLAERCDLLIAADFHADAVAAARQRTAGLPNVEVRQLLLPQQWPREARFDLVVLSEIGYFLSRSAWAELCARTRASLAADATVLACHWRRDFAERSQATDTLHACLGSALALPRQTRVSDADFAIDVWTTSSLSVAEAGGLA